MKIVKSKSVDLEQIIKQFDESILLELVQLAFQCRKDTEGYNLRNELYKSKYKASNLERKELELERFLQSFQNIRTENQNKEYKWVKINTDKMADISYRFYIAPNPNNLHELVQRLTEAFSKANVPVRFKYQLTTNMEQCDRIIIYTDYNNKDLVEQTINSVYQSSKRLFEGCERSPAWIYDSKTPGVYFAPETPKAAYSERLTDALLEAKLTFNYLYGMTNSNKSITFSGNDTTAAIINIMINASLNSNKNLTSKLCFFFSFNAFSPYFSRCSRTLESFRPSKFSIPNSSISSLNVFCIIPPNFYLIILLYEFSIVNILLENKY